MRIDRISHGWVGVSQKKKMNVNGESGRGAEILPVPLPAATDMRV
jgi:hypothetical protein